MGRRKTPDPEPEKNPVGQPRVERPATVLGRFGANVELCRKSRGWTIHDLSRASGVSSAAVIKIEGGRVDPKFTSVLAIANALKKDLTYLLRNEIA